MRDCPVAGHPIEAFECAAARHTTYACPESCPFNVFTLGSYDRVQSIEHSADEKFIKWIIEHAADPKRLAEDMRGSLDEGPNPAYFHRLAWDGVYRVGPRGDTCLGEWAKAGFSGLSTDERILMRGRLRMKPAMLEVHRILDDKRVEVADLLDSAGSPFVIVDTGFARQVARFEVYGVDIYPLPHYTRLLGTCLLIPDFHPLGPEEVIHEIIRHLGGPNDDAGRRAWLAEHFEMFDESLEAVALARRQAMIDALDAQFGKAVYALTQPAAECIKQLATVPEIEPDSLEADEQSEGFTEGRVWFAAAGDAERQIEGEGAVLGRILVGPTHWRLEAIGAERLAQLRDRFEQLMKERVSFAGERRDDLGAQMRLKEPTFASALVPPSLLRETQKILLTSSRIGVPPGTSPDESAAAGFNYDREREILDQPIPALDNKTPRAAALEPALRPKLLRWMKFWVSQTDRRNLETGRNDDTNWMVRELGLTEILFDPPPPRPPTPITAYEDDEDDEDLPPYMTLPDPPALPDRPWTRKEAAEHLDRAIRSFSSVSEVPDYFTELQYPLFPDLNELLGDQLNDEEIVGLFHAVAWIVLCFAPRGTRPPDVVLVVLEQHLRRRMGAVLDWSEAAFEAEFTAWVESSAQPHLLRLILGLTMDWLNKAPAEVQIRDASKSLIITALPGVVDALDEAARREG